jgi:hypothetical protein
MRLRAQKVLNVAVMAALGAGLFGWWQSQWPPDRSQLDEHSGQFISHQFTRERGRPPREDLVLRNRNGVEARFFVDSSYLPNLETLSGQHGSVSADRNGRAYRLEVNGVERLAFETVSAHQTKRAFAVLVGVGLVYITFVLLVAFRLWRLLQPDEPANGTR